RPGFPPAGETGKGEIRLPSCRRQFELAWCRSQARRWLRMSLPFYYLSLQIPITHLYVDYVDPLDFLSRSLADSTHSFALRLFARSMGRGGPGASWGPISSPGPSPP